MTFEEYEKAAGSTAIYPGQGTALGLMYVALKMNGEAGEFAEHVGKALRDDRLVKELPFTEDSFPVAGTTAFLTASVDPARRELLIKEIGDVLWYLAAAARELGTDLATIARGNIEKLAKRKAEGKLGGSGDTR